ncbi:MAG TPA: hypothetical protein VN844_02125 [Pyrinomonadaceae bacterium]|nr:hypothetical protein [Pyrinomonadaceae bacterium]
MVSVTHTAEVLASVVHTLTSLSVIVTHLTATDPYSAVDVTVVGLLCLVAITLVGAGCEILRWKIRQYIELANTKPKDPRKPRG